ncbi:MAG TPA: MFS transporter, partial [Deinococcales bacterium]|nr:MFS transporter [Deinococcales bacterium]
MSRAVASPASGLVGLFSLPGYLNLSAAVLMLGLSSSLAGPYMSLYASNALGAAPVMLGVYMTSIAVSGIVGSTLLAARSDRTRDRRAWLLASLALA